MKLKDGYRECPDCNGVGVFEDISVCCGATREPDLGLCYECHDHCDPCVCDVCEGEGQVPMTDEEIADEAHFEKVDNWRKE
jgi:hypothetical protein